MDKIFEIFTAKRGFPKAELCKVHIVKNKAVATDTFKLLEMEVSKADIVTLGELDKACQLRLAVPLETKLFPDYKKIIPSDKDLKNEYISVSVDAKYLRDVADAMARCSNDKRHPRVEIFIPKVNTKPLVFKVDKATALLMPRND